MNFIRITEVDSLLETSSPKIIESQLIDYIMSLRNDNISYSTIKYLVAPIFTFYQLNDVTLNKKKVFRYLGEYKRVVKDKAYTTDQIRQALQNADQRMRMIILLLASTGCRIGALPSLHLEISPRYLIMASTKSCSTKEPITNTTLSVPERRHKQVSSLTFFTAKDAEKCYRLTKI